MLRAVDGQCDARLGRVLDAVVVAHYQSNQVRAHGHRFVKVVLHLDDDDGDDDGGNVMKRVTKEIDQELIYIEAFI